MHEFSQQGRRLELHAMAHVLWPVCPSAFSGTVVSVAIPARPIRTLCLFHRTAVWTAGIPARYQDVVQLLQIHASIPTINICFGEKFWSDGESYID